MGNDNQMALLRQSLFMKDAGQGNGMGAYSNSVVSDGLMFKKTVLTPEEILGRKVQSMQAPTRTGVVEELSSNIFSDQLNNDDPLRPARAGGALLPGSTNRASQKRKAKAARTSMAAKNKGKLDKGKSDKEEEKEKEAAAKQRTAKKSMSMRPSRSGESTASMAHGLGVERTDARDGGSKASLAQFFNKNAQKAASMRVRTAGPGAQTEPEDEMDGFMSEPEPQEKRGLFKRLGQTFKGGASGDESDAMMGHYQKNAAKRFEAKEAAQAAKDAAAKLDAAQAAAARKRAQSAAPARVQPSPASMSVANREGSLAGNGAAVQQPAAPPAAEPAPGAGGEGGLKRMMTGFKRIMTAGRADNSLMAAADRALASEGGMGARGAMRAGTAGPGASHFLSAEHAPKERDEDEYLASNGSRPGSGAAPSRGASRPSSSTSVRRPSTGTGLAASGRPIAESNEIEVIAEEDEEYVPPLPPMPPLPPAPAPPPLDDEGALVPASPMAANADGEAPRASASLTPDAPADEPAGSGGAKVRVAPSMSDHIEQELDEVFGAPLDVAQVRHLPHNSEPVADPPSSPPAPAVKSSGPSHTSPVGEPPRSPPSARGSVSGGSGVRSGAQVPTESRQRLVLDGESSGGSGSGEKPQSPSEVTACSDDEGKAPHQPRAHSSSSTTSSNGVRAKSTLPLLPAVGRSDEQEGDDHAMPSPHVHIQERESRSSHGSADHLLRPDGTAHSAASSVRFGVPAVKRVDEDEDEDDDPSSGSMDSRKQQHHGGVAIPMMDDEDGPASVLKDDKPAKEEKKGGFFGRLFGGKDDEKRKRPRALDSSVMPVTDDQMPRTPNAHQGNTAGVLRSSMSQLFTGQKNSGKHAWSEDGFYGKVPLRNPSMLLMGQEEDPWEEDIDDVHYQMMMWNAFASAWDDVIDDLNHGDIISEKEVSMLKFVRLDLGSRSHGLRPILLPTFFYAGQIRKVVDTGQVSVPQVMVLTELRMLCVWMGCQIGLLSGKHAHVINDTPFIAQIINVKHAMYRKKCYMAGIKLVDLLESMCQMQEVPFDMREFADQLLIILTSLEGEAYAIIKHNNGKPERQHDIDTATILLEVLVNMKRDIASDPNRLKVVFKNALLTSATANYKELLKVIRVLKRMLRATVAEATPDSEEAQRVLGFFVNSLSHPSMDKPPSVDKMRSHSIITPLYEEDVLYPLDAGALAKELNLKKKNMTDLLGETDDSISLMAYLKAMFPGEWSNFKERMKTLVPDIKVDELSETDFAPGEKGETRRGQRNGGKQVRPQVARQLHPCPGLVLQPATGFTS